MTQTGSFEFYDNYSESAQKLQPELYNEIRRILNTEFMTFQNTFQRKPRILEIGSAGLLPYNLDLIDKAILLDLFDKPENLHIDPICEWITGDILSDSLPHSIRKYGQLDYVIMSSLLHHLCNENNEIIHNLERCFFNSRLMLSNTGKIFIFESTCPKNITKAEDILYPIYSKILKKIFNFTYVRLVSSEEIAICLKKAGLIPIKIPFKQPSYIAQMYWSIPTKYYPLKIDAIMACHNTDST